MRYIVGVRNALGLRSLSCSRRTEQNYSHQLAPFISVAISPARLLRGLLCDFSPLSSVLHCSMRKLGLQRQPIGFLGVVEETKVLGNGVGGQACQVGPPQTHECFSLGA